MSGLVIKAAELKLSHLKVSDHASTGDALTKIYLNDYLHVSETINFVKLTPWTVHHASVSGHIAYI